MKPYTIKCSHEPDYTITVDAPYYFAFGIAKGIAKVEKCKTTIIDKDGKEVH